VTNETVFDNTPGDDLLRTPRNRIVGWLAGPDEAETAITDLKAAGFDPDEISVISGDEGVRRLDPDGSDHGLRGRVIRVVQGVTSIGDDLFGVAEHVAAGGVIVSVPFRDDDAAATAARVLRARGVERMRRFDSLTYTDLG
jgi:hypothetical protein